MKKLFLSISILFVSTILSAQWSTNGNNIYFNTGKVSINTLTPSPANDVYFTLNRSQIIYGEGANLFFGGINNTASGWGEYGIEYHESEGGLNFWKPAGSNGFKNWILFLKDDGRVGIGTQSLSDNFLLTVAGGIHTREVLITETAGADFVFEDDYNLRSLSEVEQFINQNNHLPDIAPASEMQENGVKMGEFQIQLLQKIEELTLYVIEQQKEIEALKARLAD